MVVEHTKFRPDEGFRNIWQHVDRRSNVLSIPELSREVSSRSDSSLRFLFSVEAIQNWKVSPILVIS